MTRVDSPPRSGRSGGSRIRRSLFWLLAALMLAAFLISIRLAWFPGLAEPPYRPVTTFGAPGSSTEAATLHQPTGIAVADGEVFVSSSGDGRIVVYDLDGRFLRAIGGEGTPAGRLERPMHIDVRGGRLYAPEYLADRVRIFTTDGDEAGTFGESGNGPGQLDAPAGATADRDGRVWVADFYNHRVQLLRPDGSFVRQLGATGEPGRLPGHLNYPTDAALLPNDHLVVADAYNHRIKVVGLGAEGAEVLEMWGGPFGLGIPADFHTWFHVATGIGVSADAVFVADFYNHRIQKLRPDGTFLTAFGSQGSGPGELDRPTDVAVGPDGRAYVVDFGNDRIQVFAAGRGLGAGRGGLR